MTNEEFKVCLKKNGASEAEIEKITANYDIEEAERIIDAASSPREAFENIKKRFPEFDADEAMKKMDEIQRQLNEAAKEEKTGAPVQLTTEELDMIAGGGWWSDNWKRLAKAVGCGIAGALILGAGGAFIGGDVAGAPGAIVGAIVCGVIGAVAGAYYGWNYL